VAERGHGRWGETAREATRDGSRRKATENALQAAPLLVLALGLAGALLLVATEFTAVATVDVASGSCEVIQDTNPDLADRCELSGFERNGGAFILLALLAALMAFGAGFGRSRPAAFALVGIGVLVLLWALLVDLPVTDETGAIGRNFEGAEAAAGPGLTLEIVGGVAIVAAGVVALLLPARSVSEREPPPAPERG
jgi:hypothetical protein